MAEIDNLKAMLPTALTANAAPAAPPKPKDGPSADAKQDGKTATDTPTKVAGDKNAADANKGKPSGLGLPPEGSISVPGDPIKGTTVTSIGDPHEMTGDGMAFDNMETGTFVKLRAKTGDFELQTKQEPWVKNPQTTVNTAVGVKVNGQGDTVLYDGKTGKFSFNGKEVEVGEGKPFEVPGGGKIEKTPEGYAITSEAGDKVEIAQRKGYVDVRATVSAERVDGDISGSLGRLDADTDFTNDLVDRNGKVMTDVAKFIEEWRAKDGEDMFAAKGAKPPATDTKPPAGDKKPPVDEKKPPADEKKPPTDEKKPPTDPKKAPIDDKKPAVPDESAKLMDDIKKAIAKLKGDPANKEIVALLEQIEKLIGAPNAADQAGRDKLEAEMAKLEPNKTAGIEELLKLIAKWLELEQKRRDAKKAEADALDKVAKVAA